MAKYIPLQSLVYNYSEANEITSIRSHLRVGLSLHETIEIQEPLEIDPSTFYLELWVITDLNKPADYTWEAETLIDLSSKKLYDPATIPPPQKIPTVRSEIIGLLNLYRSPVFSVITVVTRPTPNIGGKVTNTISGSGAIEL